MRGIIETRLADGLVVAVGGVGLRVLTSGTSLEATGAPGEQVHLHTHLHVREDALTRFGFTTPEELRLFELLLTVGGVGPRVALSLLSAFTAEALRDAIAQRDADKLTRVPGVGRKTAERLVLELHGKVGPRGVPVTASTSTAPDGDVLSALTMLGFGLPEAQEAVRALPSDAPSDLEERIKLALQFFQRTR
ncbi:MAG TPA: Holliday junction branch migration protein RuvA [Chloroflexota bacterium]|nr:Holliday junction branch migration protein RuvA [Chloroflexota bacterium]